MKKQKENHSDLTMNETAVLFHVSSITISNWIKEGFLELDENRYVTQESIQKFQKKFAGKIKLQARANKSLKDEFDANKVDRVVQEELKSDAFDQSICDRYEAMLSESYKNKEGVFYTPMTIVDDMMQDVEVSSETLFLDPCCGTGNFLVKAVERGVHPEHLYGFDTDPNAVLIARRRIKALTGCETPHIVCGDFFQECSKLNVQFNLVFTNPPWGKKLPKEERTKLVKQYQAGYSTDTCSLFLFSILSVLSPDGVVGLLMPESFFNIAVYEDARKAVLQKTILKIKDYGKPFKNMYSACSIIVQNKDYDASKVVVCVNDGTEYERMQKSFFSMPKHILNYWTRGHEMAFIERLMRQPYITLKGHADWGLGIVTGNNAQRCKRSRRGGLKAVYRGKDILPGRLSPAKLFINPKDFPRYQQMASMEMLCAPEKLIYRFISSDLVFYCDTRQRYILNSANMLVLDDTFPLSASQLAGLMNSPLTNWLFRQLFHTHKVLRGDLEVLPIFTDLSLHRSFNFLDLNGQSFE
jgi:site-specific DNA-methyltransferase (adenine-specific)